VSLDCPFHFTSELGTKLVPVSESVKFLSLEAIAGGLRLNNEGAGLLTVNSAGAYTNESGGGSNTTILAVPALAMSAADIVALSWSSSTKVVGRSVPFQRTLTPL